MTSNIGTKGADVSAVIAASAVEAGVMPELLAKDVIKKDQDGIRVSLVKLDVAIHANAVQCLMHAEKHGDTSLMRRLLIDIVDDKSGYRRQGLIAWMRRFSPMELRGDVIKLTGTINGEPIPFDVATANITPFTSIPEFAEKVEWRPQFKDGFVGKIERALRDYRSAVENTKIENGRVVGPIDPKKPYYEGIHLEKMDQIFDEISAASAKFETFSDDTATVHAARKQRAEAEATIAAAEAKVEQQAEAPVEEEPATTEQVEEPATS